MHPRHLTACVLAAAPIVAATASPVAASQARPDIAISTSSAVAVVLRSPPGDQLRAYAAAVSHPANNGYRHPLTPAALRHRFGAPAGTVVRATARARTAGMQVRSIDATGTRLPLAAKASTVRRALGVTLYDRMTDGVRVRSASVLWLPACVAPDITAVTGLDQHLAFARQAWLASAMYSARGAYATTARLGRLYDGCPIGAWAASAPDTPLLAVHTFVLAALRRTPQTPPVLLRPANPIRVAEPALVTICRQHAVSTEPQHGAPIAVPGPAMTALDPVAQGCLVRISPR